VWRCKKQGKNEHISAVFKCKFVINLRKVSADNVLDRLHNSVQEDKIGPIFQEVVVHSEQDSLDRTVNNNRIRWQQQGGGVAENGYLEHVGVQE
jgi:hypothetical protein